MADGACGGGSTRVGHQQGGGGGAGLGGGTAALGAGGSFIMTSLDTGMAGGRAVLVAPAPAGGRQSCLQWKGETRDAETRDEENSAGNAQQPE